MASARLRDRRLCFERVSLSLFSFFVDLSHFLFFLFAFIFGTVQYLLVYLFSLENEKKGKK